MDTLLNFSNEVTTTREVAATNTNQPFAIPTRSSSNTRPYTALKVTNAGTKSVFIKFGPDNTVAVTLPDSGGPTLGDLCIPAGAVVLLGVTGTYYALKCKSTESTTVYVTPGWGN